MRSVRTAAAVLLGALVAALGTVAHRGHAPWGLVAALVLVLTAGVMCRAWNGWLGLGGYALGLLVVVPLLARTGPGGDVLVPAGERVSWIWLIGSAVATVLTALVPRRMFDVRPLPARAGAPGSPE